MQPMKKLYAILIAATALAIGSAGMASVEPASVQQPSKLTALVGGALIDVVNSTVLLHLQNSGHNNQFWHTNMTDRYEREVFPANLEQLLLAGVTTARDMGTTLNIFNVIKRVNAG